MNLRPWSRAVEAFNANLAKPVCRAFESLFRYHFFAPNQLNERPSALFQPAQAFDSVVTVSRPYAPAPKPGPMR